MSSNNQFAVVFGRNLVRCRERAGLSQEELGFIADVHRTAVGQLERGRRIARTDTLVRLCGSLGVGSEVLLAGLRYRPTRIAVGGLEFEEVELSEANEAKAEKEAIKPRSQEQNREQATSSKRRQ